jgi:hypothetical protein
MITTASTQLLRLFVVCCIAQMMLFSTETIAQERLQLSATSEQGALATYSEPLDVRRHSLWDDRRPALDLRTFRLAGAVRNSGNVPVRLIVFSVPDEAYQQMGARSGERTLQQDRERHLPIFSIDIAPSTVVDLRDHAPRDPAALQRLMTAGPVRFGLLATSSGAARATRIEVSGVRSRTGERTLGSGSVRLQPLAPVVRAGIGEVSLLETRTFPGETFFPGQTFSPR